MTQLCTGLSAWVETELVVTLGASTRMTVARRCADMAEVVAIADAGRSDVVLLSPGLQGADRSSVADLERAGVAVVGVFPPLDEVEERVLRQWEIATCVPADADLEALELAIDTALSRSGTRTAQEPPEEETPQAPNDLEGDEPPECEVIVVWGPHGAPGRSTVAINTAAELEQLGHDVVLIDLDLHAPSIAQSIGLLDEAPGIAASTRLAEAGRLDVVSLAGVAPVVGDRMRVLTGLPRAARWPEIRPDAIRMVIEQCRSLARYVVIDIAAPLEDDEELSYDTRAPRRNGAALTALAHADRVLAVASADPIGLQRLVRDLDRVRDVVTAPVEVVVTKVRSSAVGMSPRTTVANALERFAGLSEPHLVADDRAALDKAMLQGRLLLEVAPDSPARRDLHRLALDVVGQAEASRATRRAFGIRALRRRVRSSAV